MDSFNKRHNRVSGNVTLVKVSYNALCNLSRNIFIHRRYYLNRDVGIIGYIINCRGARSCRIVDKEKIYIVSWNGVSDSGGVERITYYMLQA